MTGRRRENSDFMDQSFPPAITKDDAPDRPDDMDKKAPSTTLRLALSFLSSVRIPHPPFRPLYNLHALRYVSGGLESLPTASPYR